MGENIIKMKCPYCDHKFDGHKNISGNENHKDEDISFCIKCGRVGQFKGNAIVVTEERNFPIETQIEIARLRDAWTKAMKKDK